MTKMESPALCRAFFLLSFAPRWLRSALLRLDRDLTVAIALRGYHDLSGRRIERDRRGYLTTAQLYGDRQRSIAAAGADRRRSHFGELTVGIAPHDLARRRAGRSLHRRAGGRGCRGDLRACPRRITRDQADHATRARLDDDDVLLGREVLVAAIARLDRPDLARQRMEANARWNHRPDIDRDVDIAFGRRHAGATDGLGNLHLLLRRKLVRVGRGRCAALGIVRGCRGRVRLLGGGAGGRIAARRTGLGRRRLLVLRRRGDGVLLLLLLLRRSGCGLGLVGLFRAFGIVARGGTLGFRLALLLRILATRVVLIGLLVGFLLGLGRLRGLASCFRLFMLLGRVAVAGTFVAGAIGVGLTRRLLRRTLLLRGRAAALFWLRATLLLLGWRGLLRLLVFRLVAIGLRRRLSIGDRGDDQQRCQRGRFQQCVSHEAS